MYWQQCFSLKALIKISSKKRHVKLLHAAPRTLIQYYKVIGEAGKLFAKVLQVKAVPHCGNYHERKMTNVAAILDFYLFPT